MHILPSEALGKKLDGYRIKNSHKNNTGIWIAVLLGKRAARLIASYGTKIGTMAQK